MRTGFPFAALHGRLTAVWILLDDCRHVANCTDSSGVTPLMDAAKGDHTQVVQRLLHDSKVSDFIVCVDS